MDSKESIVKLKLLISQAYQWYGMLFNGPLIVYSAWKLTPNDGFFNKQMFLLLLFVGVIALGSFTIWYFRTIYPVELEYCFRASPQWKELIKK
jgi:hypothetical protein